MMKFLEWNIQDKNLLWLIRKYLKAGIMEQGKFEPTEEGSAQGLSNESDACKYIHASCADVVV